MDDTGAAGEPGDRARRELDELGVEVDGIMTAVTTLDGRRQRRFAPALERLTEERRALVRALDDSGGDGAAAGGDAVALEAERRCGCLLAEARFVAVEVGRARSRRPALRALFDWVMALLAAVVRRLCESARQTWRAWAR